jgi:Histidine kinase-, DNA gyrase B-, and HSP90-like ATPase
MGLIKLKVAPDHVETLANSQKPVLGLEELIWNGLDADASRVEVVFDENEMGYVYQIRVIDNGAGIPHSQCQTVFGSLGGSAKRFSLRTPSGRKTHGKSGKGRFRAFGVGKRVEWISTYRSLDTVKRYSIHALREKLSEFPFSDPITAPEDKTGVEVVISELFGRVDELREDSSRMELGRKLSPYLSSYPAVQINFDGTSINVDEYKSRTDRLTFPVSLPDGTVDHATLTIVEWNNNAGRTLYLCDADGVAIHEADPGLRARSVNFTAYLTSPAVTELINSGESLLSELDPLTKAILKATRENINAHFRKRESERSVDLVKKWRKEKIYPYKSKDIGPIEKAEREVFDICALKVYEYLPGFQKHDSNSQRLTFQLIREALKTSPSSLKKILEAALGMPIEQQEELANLLEKTSLTAIINASKLVMDRLAFLESINDLLFGTFKKELLERTQFHRILVEELWIFGEQYLLGVDDQGLRALLEQHIKILNREVVYAPEVEIFDLVGRRRILDLMLHRRIPQTVPDCHEHLVIELKAPTCVIGQPEIEQIKRYAYAVLDNERFDKDTTRWTFLLVGNRFGKYAELECAVDGRERGHITALNGGKVNIHVLEWSSILASVKWRYEFFRSKLEYQASSSDGIEYLKRMHSEYLPDLAEAGDGDSD